ncbi:hypothetical protein QBC33DRAFT_329326 [Phialemonium atrogriseum]|uniref:Major facilitator superfamily (MFS) profile domain-containing protein n=1 Tax=Phialemonium atrogriseum TaxID=1093897 RepID=A0AAJ0FJ85_9PEZI|nr:uncharacterized protein QBC33DRAFT_329326 [Phialemonium atrogriseum]KAK1769647.1 hypothetical protein QBC33DRAFT_329326 [Phialemonium atrogriseum]
MYVVIVTIASTVDRYIWEGAFGIVAILGILSSAWAAAPARFSSSMIRSSFSFVGAVASMGPVASSFLSRGSVALGSSSSLKLPWVAGPTAHHQGVVFSNPTYCQVLVSHDTPSI